jgi:hypothetical protein
MMGFLNFFFSWSRPVDPVPRQEIERVKAEYGKKLRELQDAVAALQSEHDDGHGERQHDGRRR